jgi:hypothetical protein
MRIPDPIPEEVEKLLLEAFLSLTLALEALGPRHSARFVIRRVLADLHALRCPDDEI